MLHRLWNTALVMLIVSYGNLWSAENRVVYALSEATQEYEHVYTDAEIATIRSQRPTYSGNSIAVDLTEILAGQQATGVLYGTNYYTWQGVADAPRYWPDGYYELDEQQQPRLLCNIGDLFPLEDGQGQDLFPQPVLEPQLQQRDMRFLLGGLCPSLLALVAANNAEPTQQFAAVGIGMLAGAGMLALGKYLHTNARHGLYTFTPLEVQIVKQHLRSRLPMQHAALQNAVVASRVHQIIDEVVNSTTGYPVVYINADRERSPSRVINATTHGPRRTTTDALWVADIKVEDSYGEKMARHKFGQINTEAYKCLMFGGGVGLVIASSTLGLLLLERYIAS